MKINILGPVGGLKAGDVININPNSINYWVGMNGCGKTVTMSALAHHIAASTKTKTNWNTRPAHQFAQTFSFEGFEGVTAISHYTAKSRQSQWIDLDMAIESAAGIGSLHSSEGMNAQAELVRAFQKYKDDPNHLFLFDEIDGNLDARAKAIYFDYILPTAKGTKIVCTHDCLFPIGHEVFDFESKSYKPFKEYFDFSANLSKMPRPSVPQPDAPKLKTKPSNKKKI